MTTFAKALTAALRDRGLSQKELAAKLGVSAPFVSLLCAGKRRPFLHHAQRIAEVLDIPLSELAGSPPIVTPITTIEELDEALTRLSTHKMRQCVRAVFLAHCGVLGTLVPAGDGEAREHWWIDPDKELSCDTHEEVSAALHLTGLVPADPEPPGSRRQ